ncbi:hypothetical protein [Deinococcus budaensis]|uniref:Uncharacterized protein n=1 Tax=Deinococcus budaensis TaxID=1665626 RepID=A0A7W8LRW2_9DEIO|nr:hypothetical protein [Deinococcus budaensis]MBB5236060.1 hypothetical protein [Deinococcus budaensis]
MLNAAPRQLTRPRSTLAPHASVNDPADDGAPWSPSTAARTRSGVASCTVYRIRNHR